MTQTYPFLTPLYALPCVQAVYLYGSRARGDHAPKSDIDIAVVCPTADSKEWAQIDEIIENAETLLEIDCIRYDTLKDDDRMKHNIDRDKVVLFERGAE